MKTNRYDVMIQWGDCDPADIVFYANYFRWFDNGTAELFVSVGLELPKMFNDYGILGIPILDAHAKFMRPSRFRDVITVESGIESWGNSSFRVSHKVFKGDKEAIVGHEVRGWVAVDETHPNGISARRVPDDVRARFA